MSTPVWPSTQNQFLNATEGSYKKMNIVSSDTDSKLYGQQANPLIAPAFAYFNPHRALFSQKYIAWKSSVMAYHEATTEVYSLLKELSSKKIENWDARILVEHASDSTRYEGLLPDNRAPFQTGEIDERIAAVATLIERIGAEAALAALKADIIAFHGLLVAARNTQQALEGESNTKSAELEHERVACAQAMFAVLGMLMTVYNIDPSQIADYFDLETLRGHVNDIVDLLFIGSVGASQVINVLNPSVIQYITGVTLRIKNTTTGPAIGGLYFYAADNATDGWTGLGQLLNPGEEATITLTAAQFRAFFNVQNQGPNLQTYEVEIILPE
jgi:hypothetical protein